MDINTHFLFLVDCKAVFFVNLFGHGGAHKFKEVVCCLLMRGIFEFCRHIGCCCILRIRDGNTLDRMTNEFLIDNLGGPHGGYVCLIV